MSDAVVPPEGSALSMKKSGRASHWAFPLLRVLLVAGAAFLVWYVAGNWNRWTGAARLSYR